MRISLAISAMAIVLLAGCEGPRGPAGPEGTGSRVVYHGTAASDEQVVNIPEVRTDDLPLIECYYYFDNSWSAMYIDYPDDQGNSVFPYALIDEQKVVLYGINGMDYQIVIVS